MNELTYGTYTRKAKGPVAKARAKKLRMASATIRSVRAECVIRDGYCRFINATVLGPCEGASEWAHMEEHRRFKTRGQAPEARHKVEGSLMLCTKHHTLYDRHTIGVVPLTSRGAEGVMRAWLGAGVVIV